MARGPQPAASANDGMSWLALMPFPAFTPLNWWALATPRNAMLAALNNTQIALCAWRAGADGLRAMARLQQDEALRMVGASVDANTAQGEPTEGLETDEADAAAPLFTRPMVEATRAYNRVGRAFIVAQRDTLRAWSQPENPH